MLVLWGIAQLSRDTLQNGVSHRCRCLELSAKGGYHNPPLKVSHDMGYRNDNIAISQRLYHNIARHGATKAMTQTFNPQDIDVCHVTHVLDGGG